MNKPRRSCVDYCRLGSLATVIWLSCTVAVIASPSTSDGFDCTTCTILPQVELDAQRGGFSFAGLNFEFGANIRSFIDNQLVLESIITITQEGTIQHQAVSLPDNIPDASQVTNVVPQLESGTPKSVVNLAVYPTASRMHHPMSTFLDSETPWELASTTTRDSPPPCTKRLASASPAPSSILQITAICARSSRSR